MLRNLFPLIFLCIMLAGCVNARVEAQAEAALPSQAVTPSTPAALTAEVCLNNTPREGECKDCCDSLTTDAAGRKACLAACPGHDYTQNTHFTLSSHDVVEGGALPVDYTCDGSSATLPLAWSGAPAGATSFAVIMHHIASPADVHWYWVLYNIPVDVTSLARNSSGIGTLGNNSVNGKTAYAPPCSKGPGLKTYTYTVYALSAQPQISIPPAQVNREALLAAIQNITLGSATLNVTYTRPEGATTQK